MKASYTKEEIVAILSKLPARRGWDFSYMKTRREPIPWNYEEVARTYIKTSDTVLDIGTGGGEKLKKLSTYFTKGVGIDIDPEMVRIANENSPDNIEFICDDQMLNSVQGKFDVILNRHAPYDLKAIASRLKDGGIFITQQVGEKNMKNIKEVLGFKIPHKPTISKQYFDDSELKIVNFMEYDVRYEVLDIESLFFWLKALDMLSADMDGERAFENIEATNKLLAAGIENGAFVTNEHRYLVIAKKYSDQVLSIYEK